MRTDVQEGRGRGVEEDVRAGQARQVREGCGLSWGGGAKREGESGCRGRHDGMDVGVCGRGRGGDAGPFVIVVVKGGFRSSRCECVVEMFEELVAGGPESRSFGWDREEEVSVV